MNIHNELYALLFASAKEIPSAKAPPSMNSMYLDAYDIYLSVHGEVKDSVIIFLQ